MNQSRQETDRFPEQEGALSAAGLEYRRQLAARKGSVPAPYGLLLHSPAVAQAFESLSSALWQGALPRRVMEGLFLLNAQRHLCRDQWVRHVGKARDAGLAQEVIDCLGAGREPAPAQDPAFHAAWQLAATLQGPGPVDDALFAQLQQHYSAAAIAELSTFCGFASIVSNALRVRQPGMPADSEGAPF